MRIQVPLRNRNPHQILFLSPHSSTQTSQEKNLCHEPHRTSRTTVTQHPCSCNIALQGRWGTNNRFPFPASRTLEVGIFHNANLGSFFKFFPSSCYSWHHWLPLVITYSKVAEQGLCTTAWSCNLKCMHPWAVPAGLLQFGAFHRQQPGTFPAFSSCRISDLPIFEYSNICLSVGTF